MASPLPTAAQEVELHRRLLAQDKTAHEELAEFYYAPLMEFLRRRNAAWVSDDLISDALFQTWASLCQRPTSFDGKGSLWSFLRLSARRDLQNEIAKKKRQDKRIDRRIRVEDCRARGNDHQEESAERAERARREVVPELGAGLSERERQCLDLYLARERKTRAYAVLLGITDQPKEEQEVVVKRLKDRFQKRIERVREKP